MGNEMAPSESQSASLSNFHCHSPLMHLMPSEFFQLPPSVSRNPFSCVFFFPLPTYIISCFQFLLSALCLSDRSTLTHFPASCFINLVSNFKSVSLLLFYHLDCLFLKCCSCYLNTICIFYL